MIFLMQFFDAEMCEFQIFANVSRRKNAYAGINKCTIKVKGI